MLTAKQLKLIKEGNTSLNISIGATGAGKTYIDILYRIPERIRACRKYKGLIVICGNTLDTIDDNILDPLREVWGDKNIPQRSRGSTIIMLFGVKVRLIGASDKRRVDAVRGKNIKYAYCDEVVTYNEAFFKLLLSRMRCTDKRGNLISKIDCTCNPEHNQHWFKKTILDKDEIKKYVMNFVIDDNEYLPKEFVENLKTQYKDTVYYNRYILGLWANAEGLCFTTFANNTDKYLINPLDYKYQRIVIGVDFGDSVSKTIYIACGLAYVNNKFEVHLLEHYNAGTHKGANELGNEHLRFYNMVKDKYGIMPLQSWCDHNGAVIETMRQTHLNNNSRHCLDKVDKSSIHTAEWITLLVGMFNMERLKINKNCQPIIDSFSSIMYDDKRPNEILDNGSADVDTYDACRYAMIDFIKEGRYKWI